MLTFKDLMASLARTSSEHYVVESVRVKGQGLKPFFVDTPQFRPTSEALDHAVETFGLQTVVGWVNAQMKANYTNPERVSRQTSQKAFRDARGSIALAIHNLRRGGRADEAAALEAKLDACGDDADQVIELLKRGVAPALYQ